jgi:hypothetical protein
MDNYIQPILAWITGTPVSVPLLISAVPLIGLVVEFRVISILAAAVLAGCAVGLHLGMAETTAVVLALASCLALNVMAGVVIRRQARRFGRQLTELSNTVRTLQTSEERRQTFLARKLLPNWSPPIEGDGPGVRPTHRSNGHLADEFTEVS